MRGASVLAKYAHKTGVIILHGFIMPSSDTSSFLLLCIGLSDYQSVHFISCIPVDHTSFTIFEHFTLSPYCLASKLITCIPYPIVPLIEALSNAYTGHLASCISP